jgi:hypothetical protein
MRTRNLGAAVLAASAVAAVTLPASAEPSGYTIAPAGPADPRNNYVPQAGAVFVVDDAKGAIIMCSPTTRTTRSWSFARRRPSCRNRQEACQPVASVAVGDEAA